MADITKSFVDSVVNLHITQQGKYYYPYFAKKKKKPEVQKG